MDLATITAICSELASAVAGRKFGKIFQLSKFDMAVDLRLSDSRYLFLSIDPSDPRTYLIRRRLRDLEKASTNPTSFALLLRKHLSGAVLTAIEQVVGERVLIFAFTGSDDLGAATDHKFVAQLTGRSANLFLLDHASVIVAAARQTNGPGQRPGDVYGPPARAAGQAVPRTSDIPDRRESVSEYLDRLYTEKAAAKEFDRLATAARSKLDREIAKHKKLTEKLKGDLAAHGDAGKWKRYGDLLLANAATARRDRGTAYVVDYFDEAAPEIAIETDENDSITEAAEKFFRRYTKARNAQAEIANRLRDLETELERLRSDALKIDAAIAQNDERTLLEFAGAKARTEKKVPSAKRGDALPGVRRFTSSDGYEILVGKKAKDNDFLTFRVARSLDTWMHAADYPGSHVVVRNPHRGKEIPHRTLIEAAELAAFYSQGKSQPKAAVHYTQKKFVNKPRGAAPGLVSLSSFKTILVEPKVGVNGE